LDSRLWQQFLQARRGQLTLGGALCADVDVWALFVILAAIGRRLRRWLVAVLLAAFARGAIALARDPLQALDRRRPQGNR
jgi:Kef-type K+ transport system membrane component KefB